MVSRLDVVAELAAHQQNLTPDPCGPHRALVALPPVALADLIAPDWHAFVRAAELGTLAEQLGGGDGPLAIVDLGLAERVDGHDRSGAAAKPAVRGVDGRLARLWEAGIRHLFVHGARDQPGFARALGYRWPGGLTACDASYLDALLDPREPVAVLAPGLVRVAPGVALPRGGERVLVAVDDDGDPRRIADQGPQVSAYAIDRARQLGPWAGVVPPRGLLGTAAGAAIRTRWEAYWSERGRDDVVRAAVLGLDPRLEAGLREVRREASEPGASSGQRTPSAADAPATGRRARLIAITGIDGAGKSTHVARLARMLQGRGARISVIKLYRQGAFLELANQLGARTRRGAPLAAFRVSRVVKLVDSLRVFRDQLAHALAACDAVVLDRYVETHVAAAESQLGWELSDHPALSVFPAADLRFWLRLDPGVALARREARGEPASADEHAIGLAGSARVFDRLAAAAGEVVLDAGADEGANAEVIHERARAIVACPGTAADRSSLVAPAGLPRVRSARRCTLHVGVDPDRPALGAELPALRADLVRWSGTAGAVPEAFWLEAYAAQLVIDVVTWDPARAAVALWPGAVAGMARHADLVMLHELERILAPLVEVETYDPRAETYEPAFSALGACRAAARRLARDYAVELERVAAELGWTAMAIDGRASTAAPSAPAS